MELQASRVTCGDRLTLTFVLFLAEEHWSPGDIGGTFKGQQLIPPRASVMAVVVDTDAYYLPHHGLQEGFAERLKAFSDFHRRHRLVRRDK